MTRRLGAIAVLFAALLATLSAHPTAAQNRCADPQGECGAFVEASCLSGRVGAGTLAAAPAPDDARCRTQFGKYRECLAEIALVCDPATLPDDNVAGGCAPDLEQRLWDTVKDSSDPGELSIFVDTCPDSPFALIAKRRIDAAATAPVAGSATAVAPATTPGANQGYVGAYKGGWTNPQLGASGRSEFVAISYDPKTGALRGRMASEYNGTVSQGDVLGLVTLAQGGRLSGIIRAPDNTGWAITINLEPSDTFDVMSGSFQSVPLPGNYAPVSNGVFTTRRVK